MATRIKFFFRRWAPTFGCRVPEYTLEGLLDNAVADGMAICPPELPRRKTVTPGETGRAIGFDMPSSQNLDNLTGTLPFLDCVANRLSTSAILKLSTRE